MRELRMAVRVWANEWPVFWLLHFLLSSCSSPATLLSSPRCPLLRWQEVGKYKGDKHTLIVTFSNVYVLFSPLPLPSPLLPLVTLSSFLDYSSAHFSLPPSLLFVVYYLMFCSDAHMLLRRSWPSMACSTSISPLFHFILSSSFSFLLSPLLIILIQACSLSRNQ